jgi:DNA-binding NarL/FixJ family response regulator
MTEVSVLVVDDHEPFRRAMAAVVEATDGFLLVGAVGSGEAALEAVESLGPSLVLMDVNLPGMDGIEATRRLRSVAGAPAVVLLSSQDAGEFDLRGCGAAAYVPKSSFGPDGLTRCRALTSS